MNGMFYMLVIKELTLQKKHHYLTLHKVHVKLPLTFSHLRLLISEHNCKNESFAPTSSFANHTVKNQTSKHQQQTQLSLVMVTTFTQ